MNVLASPELLAAVTIIGLIPDAGFAIVACFALHGYLALEPGPAPASN